MSSSTKSEYVVGQRPPVTLSKKAHKQLADITPSVQVAEFAQIVSKLMSKSVSGAKIFHIPGIASLRPDDTKPTLTAKEAAAAVRKPTSTKSSKKSATRAK
jgi:hypothetical protein